MVENATKAVIRHQKVMLKFFKIFIKNHSEFKMVKGDL